MMTYGIGHYCPFSTKQPPLLRMAAWCSEHQRPEALLKFLMPTFFRKVCTYPCRVTTHICLCDGTQHDSAYHTDATSASVCVGGPLFDTSFTTKVAHYRHDSGTIYSWDEKVKEWISRTPTELFHARTLSSGELTRLMPEELGYAKQRAYGQLRL
jgi:hypothetical protein